MPTGSSDDVYRIGQVKHGDWGSKLHRQWLGMRQRVSNPKHPSFKNYGGRGITITPEWDDYATYRAWCLENGYVEGASYRQELDRIDNDGPYAPENCRWTSPKENARNTRSNRMLTVQGETKAMAAWPDDDRCPVSYFVLRTRLNTGWSVEAAVLTPAKKPGEWHSERKAHNKGTGETLTAYGETHTLKAWSEDPRCAVGYASLHSRVHRGWDPERAVSTPPRGYAPRH